MVSTYRKATEVRIAEAMLSLLDAGSFSFSPVSFSRAPLPDLSKENLGTLKVHIAPGRLESEAIDRARDQKRYQIGIALAKSVGMLTQNRDEEVEELQAFAEEIADFLSHRSRHILTLPAVVDGSSVEIQPAHNARFVPPYIQDPIFDPRRLREESIFFSVLLFTYHFEALRV